MKKSVKRALGAGVLAGIGYAAWRAWQSRVPQGTGDVEWTTAPFPFPPAPRPAEARVHVPPEVEPGGGPETEAEGEAHVPDWLEPNPDGSCPSTGSMPNANSLSRAGSNEVSCGRSRRKRFQSKASR